MKILGKVIDIHDRRIKESEIIISRGKIVSVSQVEGDSKRWILPGIIDSHVHIESSMLVPSSFAEAAVRRGTVAVVTDPHEIANVLGTKGIDFIINNAKKVPLKFYFGMPSCVPATDFESTGAQINLAETEKLLKRKDILHLSEMMNYQGVINEDREVIEKIEAALREGKRIDGHAPGLRGKELEAYCKKGITTDHEANTFEEAEEKILRGMKIMIREGSAARNLEQLHPLFKKHPEDLMLCCDDIHPEMLAHRHIDYIIRVLLKKGYDIFDVLRSASLNPVKHYNLDVGLLQPGQAADFIVIDNPENFNILQTWIDGRKVFDNGKVLFRSNRVKKLNNFKCSNITPEQIALHVSKKSAQVIKVIDGELITGKEEISTNELDGNGISIKRDVLKLVVKDRYNDGLPSVALISGFELKRGAFASSVAHDSHNIVAIGTNDKDIAQAINLIVDVRGGLSCSNGNDNYLVPLPIAGIMTDVPCGTIASEYTRISDIVRDMDCKLKSPFMTLSFMSLLVIPHLKLSDRGLFDVDSFRFVDLFV